MSISVDQMRAVLYKQYNSAWKWINKVKAMSDAQVVAVYKRMLFSGKIKY